jgi:hypothetical protein
MRAWVVAIYARSESTLIVAIGDALTAPNRVHVMGQTTPKSGDLIAAITA